MKKTALLVASVCLLSGMVAWSAGPDPVTSVNAVGVTKLNIPSGFSMIACPFNAVGGQAISMDELFGTSLPDSTLVFLYIPGSGYISYIYIDGMGWLDDNFEPAGTTGKILRGDGFWVLCPSAVSNVCIAGEVPSAAAGTNRIDLVPGFQLVSFAFPQELSLESSGLTPNDSDIIFKYINGGYISYIYIDGMGWLDDNFEPVTVTLKPNEGFWYLSYASGTNVWNQSKTYQWP